MSRKEASIKMMIDRKPLISNISKEIYDSRLSPYEARIYIKEKKIMIKYKAPYFILETKDLTYAFGILSTGHLEHLYFGNLITTSDLASQHTKLTASARRRCGLSR